MTGESELPTQRDITAERKRYMHSMIAVVG